MVSRQVEVTGLDGVTTLELEEVMDLKPRFNEFCKVIGEPKIGSGTWIGFFTIIDGSGGLTIGENCDISSGVHIYSHDTVARCKGNLKFMDSEKTIVNRTAIERSPVVIGDNVFVGANSVIMRGCRIGDRAVIGAGSVLSAFTVVGDGEVWFGNPAVRKFPLKEVKT